MLDSEGAWSKKNLIKLNKGCRPQAASKKDCDKVESGLFR